MRSTRSWLIAAALFLMPVVAAAQETKPYPECSREPSDADIAAAKGAFQAGQASFNESDYPRAITYWEDAYRRDCTADALLLNLARAYELHNQKRQAVVALETYLARKPDSRDRASIQRRIEVLQSQIQSEPQPSTTATPTEQTTAPLPTPVDAGPTPEPEPQGKKPILPLIVAGGGGAIAIVGAILYFNAASEVEKFEKLCPSREDCDPARVDVDAANAARTRQNISGVVTIAGIAIAAGGIVWYIMSPREQPTTTAQLRKPRVAPAVAPGFAGLSVSGAF